MTAPATPRGTTPYYNCIAWSIGVTDRWVWWEVDDPFGDKDGVVEVSDFDAFYAAHGYTVTQDVGQAEILLYVDATVPKHAARRRSCACGGGQWIMFESKCGEGSRIEHRRDHLNGGVYGDHVRYYRHQ